MANKTYDIYYRAKGRWYAFEGINKSDACAKFKRYFGLKIMPNGFRVVARTEPK